MKPLLLFGFGLSFSRSAGDVILTIGVSVHFAFEQVCDLGGEESSDTTSIYGQDVVELRCSRLSLGEKSFRVADVEVDFRVKLLAHHKSSQIGRAHV